MEKSFTKTSFQRRKGVRLVILLMFGLKLLRMVVNLVLERLKFGFEDIQTLNLK